MSDDLTARLERILQEDLHGEWFPYSDAWYGNIAAALAEAAQKWFNDGGIGGLRSKAIEQRDEAVRLLREVVGSQIEAMGHEHYSFTREEQALGQARAFLARHKEAQG